jgi:two-component system, NtrC family, sensor histidine kinase KinB
MKISVRTKFASGMIFLFLIVLVLAVYSGFFINKLSNKTSAILKENYLSVVYARDMAEGIRLINQEITGSYISGIMTDSIFIKKELNLVGNSLQSEKNNLTEPGEDKLVSGIESDFTDFSIAVKKNISQLVSSEKLLALQKKSASLNQQLMVLSQMNGKALEIKTDDAKNASKKSLTQMTVLATLCLLVVLSFTFSFASYFNQRFSQLYNGIKAIVSSNYDQRLFFEGQDEFYEISLVFNEMAEKLNKNNKEMSVSLKENFETKLKSGEIEELKNALVRVKTLEKEIKELISRVDIK